MKEAPLVSIQCMVFNHEPYLRQCLDGFVMQQVTFPFEAIVHDDVSTDASAAIIREYAEKYPDIIKPFYESENQYRKGTIETIMNAAIHPESKYIALCEGDDYWTDPLKLQKQVDFLESHPDYTMCCNRTRLYSEKLKKYIGENYCYDKSQDILVEDIINRTGLFISTCSIVYRPEVRRDYPGYCRGCAVGDYPLQIMCAMKGKTFYFNETMAVYRVNNPNSWMGQQKWSAVSDNNLKRIRSMANMFLGFANDYKEYKKAFENKCAHYINTSSPDASVNPQDNKHYFNYFKDLTSNYSIKWKFDKFFRMRSNMISRFYLLHIAPRFFRFYYQRNLYYNN